MDKEQIDKAKNGILDIHFTPIKTLPVNWVNKIEGKVLVLGGGGAQHAPLLACKGCDVTLVDISEEQLNKDREIQKRENLEYKIIKGDMQDLSFLEEESFDVIFHSNSINFVSSVDKVYSEVKRVLKTDGLYFTCFANPALYMFDVAKLEKGRMHLKYTLPFSTNISLSIKEQEKIVKEHGTFEFSHTLEDLIRNLLVSGFHLNDFYTDQSGTEPIDSFLHDCYIAIFATKYRS